MRFKRDESSLGLPPTGIHLTQIVRAQAKVSSKGNSMIQCTLRSIPEGHRLFYHLVFTKDTDGMVTHFCHSAEGELILPDDYKAEFDLTPNDCLNRLVFVEIEHVESFNGGDVRANVRAILKRDKALAKAPHLAKLVSPTNVPPAKNLTAIKSSSAPPRSKFVGLVDKGDEPDSIPF